MLLLLGVHVGAYESLSILPTSSHSQAVRHIMCTVLLIQMHMAPSYLGFMKEPVIFSITGDANSGFLSKKKGKRV